MTTYIPIFLLLAGGLILTAGDILMKKWVINNSPGFFIFGLVVYLLGLIFLALSFKYKNIAIASVIMVIINVTTLLVFSWFYFKETLTPLQLIGIGLGIVSILFLELA